MRIGVTAILTTASLSSLGAQPHTAGMWVDSVNTPAFELGVSGSEAGLVRVMLRAGSMIAEIQAPAEDVKRFGDSASFLLTTAPVRAGGVAVAGAKMRLTFGAAGQQEVVHFRLGGDGGVDVQPTKYDAMRMIGILRGAAFWSAEQHRVAPRLHDLYPPTPGAGNQTYFENQVERPAALRPGNPSPKYPPMLHTAKVEGSVLAQFVVDTLGRVDSTTFHILKSTHDLFTIAVRDVVFRYRFNPAELAGHRVKQLVQMPFDFRMTP